jgi:hypothetical protein
MISCIYVTGELEKSNPSYNSTAWRCLGAVFI